MKVVAFLAILAAAVLQTQNSLIEGTVVEKETGKPISSVQIRLQPGDIMTATDANGRFRITAPPSNYTVEAQRDGYFGSRLNGVPQPNAIRDITISSGQNPPLAPLTLTPGGTVTGMVLEQSGRPPNRAPVAVMQVRYQQGQPVLVEVRSAMTNDRGEYRLYWIPPGDYLLAFNPSMSSVATSSRVGGANNQSIQTRTFFPGTSDLEKAQMVSVTPGSETSGMNFEIRTTEVSNIYGRVLNPYAAPGGPPRTLGELPLFTLVRRDRVGGTEIMMSTFSDSASAAAKQEGMFELRSIPPGRYRLYTTLRNPGNPAEYTGRVEIDLGFQDLKDVVVPVRPLRELRGRIVTPGESPELEGIAVSLLPAQSRRVTAAMSAMSATATSGGELTFKNVAEDTYRLNLVLPPGTFLADILQAGRSRHTDAVIEVSGDNPDPVQVVLGRGAGSVEGTIVHPDGKIGEDTTVVLVPDGPLRGNPILYRHARPDDAQRFRLENIAPGAYKIFAWEGVLSTAWANAEFLSKYEDRGIALRVGQGTRIRVSVNVFD